MEYLREVEGKRSHDPLEGGGRCVYVPGAVIVGAGPSGLAVAACLKKRGVPSMILERNDCIASLWQLKTYDRLNLHLPKHFCELPLMPFPSSFPTYPTKQQFIDYLESYARHFDLRPMFRQSVECAEYDQNIGFWRVRAVGTSKGEAAEYVSRWLVVATGENAEPVVPKMEGTTEFLGPIAHTSLYKSGGAFQGKKVLVVGCGNSGMEVCLDLCKFNASPSLVVRDTVHILPREMLGNSTFGLSMWLLKWFPIHIVDYLLLLASRIILGDTSKLGLNRPNLGPLQLKNITGKTPVLDVGTLSKIRSGEIKVFHGIERLTRHGAQFVDGREEEFDAVILATGYRSNVPFWLKESKFFSEKDGYPRNGFPNGWRGEQGLYAVGFTKRGLVGASMDARRIAQDIELSWNAETKKLSRLLS